MHEQMNSALSLYRDQGYLLFRGLISPEEIALMREAGTKYFGDQKTHMGTRDFLGIPCLASLPFHPKLVERIGDVFGRDFAIISQFSMMANLHSPQWHRDSQSQLGNDYLYDPDYLVAKCAVYLQDNDPDWGGGMEIVPRSHRPEFFGRPSSLSRSNVIGKLSRALQRALIRLRSQRLKPVRLPSKAGDVLLFHANLLHRASQPSERVPRGGPRDTSVVNPPRDKFKFLIDWEVTPNNKYLRTYLAHQQMRARREPGLFRESLAVRFPEDYDPALISRIRERGVHVAHYSDANP